MSICSCTTPMTVFSIVIINDKNAVNVLNCSLMSMYESLLFHVGLMALKNDKL